MMKELSGSIIEIFDSSNGIILGDDNQKYYFSKFDFIKDFIIEKNVVVIFKPEKQFIKNSFIYRAILIEKVAN